MLYVPFFSFYWISRERAPHWGAWRQHSWVPQDVVSVCTELFLLGCWDMSILMYLYSRPRCRCGLISVRADVYRENVIHHNNRLVDFGTTALSEYLLRFKHIVQLQCIFYEKNMALRALFVSGQGDVFLWQKKKESFSCIFKCFSLNSHTSSKKQNHFSCKKKESFSCIWM